MFSSNGLSSINHSHAFKYILLSSSVTKVYYLDYIKLNKITLRIFQLLDDKRTIFHWKGRRNGQIEGEEKRIKSIGTVCIKYKLKLTRKLYSYISDDESNDEMHFVFTCSKNILLTISQTLLFTVIQWDSCCWYLNI